MRFSACNRCGQPVDTFSSYCSSCGFPVSVCGKSNARPPHGNGMVGALLVAGVCVVLVIGAVISFVPKRTTPEAFHEKPPSRPAAASIRAQRPVVVDIPSLAFRTRSEVAAKLGEALMTTHDSNQMNWREGEMFVVKYRRASCQFLAGRLVTMRYTFERSKRPASVSAALEICGFPAEEVNQDGSTFPWRAFLAPNPAYRNPIQCCGLVFDWVSFPEDGSFIDVSYINPGHHYNDWPQETQATWLRLGGQRLSPDPLQWPRTAKRPRSGSH